MKRAATALLAACSLALVACSGSDSGAVLSTATIDPELPVQPPVPVSIEPPVPVSIDPSVPVSIDPSVEVSIQPSIETSVQAPVTMSERAVVPEGFTTVTVEITEADGTVCEVCMWLADSADERFRGLKGVTSLGRPEAMAFAYDRPTAGEFYMFETVTPLSIAWFAEPIDDDSGGALVSTADMEPCTSADASECERYPSGGAFVLAIEVFQGDLASIGVTEGATARVVAGTEATDCPVN